MRRRAERGAVALGTALVVVLAGTLLAAAVADVARLEARVAQARRTFVRGILAADACLAHVTAALPAGWDLAAELAGADGITGTADDGALVAPAGCAAALLAGPLGAARPFLDVAASVPGGGRRVRAIVGRSRAPIPAVVWSAAAGLGSVTGRLDVDGVDPARPDLPPLPGLGTPDDPTLVDAWTSGMPGVGLLGGTRPAIRVPAPPLPALFARLVAAGAAPTFVPSPSAPAPPALYAVAGDVTIVAPGAGAGLLYVDGRLDIQADFAFSGVVAARGGVGVASGARLDVAGGVWAGAPAFDVGGDAAVRHDRAALDVAAALFEPPRPAAVAGIVDR